MLKLNKKSRFFKETNFLIIQKITTSIVFQEDTIITKVVKHTFLYTYLHIQCVSLITC